MSGTLRNHLASLDAEQLAELLHSSVTAEVSATALLRVHRFDTGVCSAVAQRSRVVCAPGTGPRLCPTLRVKDGEFSICTDCCGAHACDASTLVLDQGRHPLGAPPPDPQLLPEPRPERGIHLRCDNCGLDTRLPGQPQCLPCQGLVNVAPPSLSEIMRVASEATLAMGISMHEAVQAVTQLGNVNPLLFGVQEVELLLELRDHHGLDLQMHPPTNPPEHPPNRLLVYAQPNGVAEVVTW